MYRRRYQNPDMVQVHLIKSKDVGKDYLVLDNGGTQVKIKNILRKLRIEDVGKTIHMSSSFLKKVAT